MAVIVSRDIIHTSDKTAEYPAYAGAQFETHSTIGDAEELENRICEYYNIKQYAANRFEDLKLVDGWQAAEYGIDPENVDDDEIIAVINDRAVALWSLMDTLEV